MKLEKAASGSKKITISKSEWLHIGKQAGWMTIAAGGQDKVNEYAQRIMKGEKKEVVLQGLSPAWTQAVDAAIAQMKGGAPAATGTQGTAPAAPPAAQGGQQYSMSKAQSWADSQIGNWPSLTEFVGKVNQAAKNGKPDQGNLKLILDAMNGDQAAITKLKERTGAQAVPVASTGPAAAPTK